MLARSKPTRSSGLRHKTPGYLPRGSRLLATTRSRIPILEDTQSLASWRANLPPKIAKETAAMYSSVLGGIVLDPALMMIPIDDHMVHRGHSVFDTANVKGNKVYGLSFHLDRLLRSAAAARIEHIPWSKQDLRQIVLDTVAAAGPPPQRDAFFVRYWLSAGRGDFSVSPKPNCTGPQFYCVCHHDSHGPNSTGVAAVTVDIPLKPDLLATMKSNNYLLNALVMMAAQDADVQLGIQTEDGMITESAVSCIGCVLDGVLTAPPFDRILASTTLARCFELAPQLIEQGLLKGIEQRPISVAEIMKNIDSMEMIDFGGGWTTAIVRMDGNQVGSGAPGPVQQALERLVLADFVGAEHTDQVQYR